LINAARICAALHPGYALWRKLIMCVGFLKDILIAMTSWLVEYWTSAFRISVNRCLLAYSQKSAATGAGCCAVGSVCPIALLPMWGTPEQHCELAIANARPDPAILSRLEKSLPLLPAHHLFDRTGSVG
jgi:hypothetical protein